MPGLRKRGRPRHDDILTPAEWRVVEAVRHGMSNVEIAARRGISADAVKYHLANVLAKLGLPNRQALRRWNGVGRHTALSKKGTAMSEQLGPIAQIARTVKDIDAARRWYGEVLGLRHLYSFANMAFFDCGGTRLYLTAEPGAPASESILYFRVGDIHAAQKTLEAKGIEFLSAPHMIHRHADGTEEWLAILKDNEERPLGLMSQVK